MNAKTSTNSGRFSGPAFHKEDSPFYWIARVNGEYSKALERLLKDAGYDIPTWRILAMLHDGGTLSVSEIATHAVAKLSTITRTVYRLEAQGLVTTATSPSDARVTVVSLTKAGERALQRILKPTTELMYRSLAKLSPATIKRLNELLQVLLESFLEEHEDKD
jgi:DNA-binding MarR family transcriptional regulator